MKIQQRQVTVNDIYLNDSDCDALSQVADILENIISTDGIAAETLQPYLTPSTYQQLCLELNADEIFDLMARVCKELIENTRVEENL